MLQLPAKEKDELVKSLMFEDIDTNGDGTISLAEMLRAPLLIDSETQELRFPEEFVADKVSETDVNGDGQVCFQEFLLFMEEL